MTERHLNGLFYVSNTVTITSNHVIQRRPLGTVLMHSKKMDFICAPIINYFDQPLSTAGKSCTFLLESEIFFWCV